MPDLAFTLQEDLEWREAELAALKLRAAIASPSTRESQLRALSSMCYAHYEGFCINAVRTFLLNIEMKRIQRGQLRQDLLIYSLPKNLGNLRGNISSRNCFDVFSRQFPEVLKEAVLFPRDEEGDIRVAGKSNLYPRLLCDVCDDLGVSHEMIDAYSTHLLLLVKRRNNIAHGGGYVVKDTIEYNAYEKATSLAMHELAVALIEMTENLQYIATGQLNQVIACRAYLAWEADGRQEGMAEHYWYKAEFELRS